MGSVDSTVWWLLVKMNRISLDDSQRNQESAHILCSASATYMHIIKTPSVKHTNWRSKAEILARFYRAYKSRAKL